MVIQFCIYTLILGIIAFAPHIIGFGLTWHTWLFCILSAAILVCVVFPKIYTFIINKSIIIYFEKYFFPIISIYLVFFALKAKQSTDVLKYPKLEPVFLQGNKLLDPHITSYIYVNKNPTEPETLVVPLYIFNYGKNSAHNINVSLLFSMESFQFVKSSRMRVVDTIIERQVLLTEQVDTIQCPYIKLTREYGNDFVLPVKGYILIDSVVLYIKEHPLIFSSHTDPPWDFDLLLVVLRYDNTLNTNPNQQWLVIASPHATAEQLFVGAKHIEQYNKSIANGGFIYLETNNLFK